MTFAIPLVLASLAHAGHHDHSHSKSKSKHSSTFLDVDNDFEGELAIYVDGRFEGTAAGSSRTQVDVKPGRRSVTVQRASTGVVLASRSVHFSKGVISVIDVAAPLAPLRVRNSSEVPLQVDVGPGDGVWIGPHATVQLMVTAGTVELEATVREAGHVVRATERMLWVEPGVAATETVLDYTPVAHTRLSLRNEDHQRLRVVVDGAEVGWLDPGERRSVSVSPGKATVRFYDRRGHLVEVRDVHADRGEKTHVVALGAPPPPRGPVRPASSCSGGSGSVRVALR